MPENLYATDVTLYQATLGWDTVPDATRYQTEVKLKNGPPGLAMTRIVTGTEFRTQPLIPLLDYRFRVRAECGELNFGPWSPWFDFTLDPSLYVVDPDTGNTSRAAGNEPPFDVYPNPSNGLVYLKYNGLQTTNARMVILDVAGIIQFEAAVVLEAGRTAPVDLSRLENGLYIITLYGEGRPIGSEVIMLSR